LLAAKFGAIFPHLDERQRRLLMDAEARVLEPGPGPGRPEASPASAAERTASGERPTPGRAATAGLTPAADVKPQATA
jgi:hypothetical protein